MASKGVIPERAENNTSHRATFTDGVLIRQSQFNVLVEQRDVVFTAYLVD